VVGGTRHLEENVFILGCAYKSIAPQKSMSMQ
jgi:hypothetical protein